MQGTRSSSRSTSVGRWWKVWRSGDQESYELDTIIGVEWDSDYLRALSILVRR